MLAVDCQEARWGYSVEAVVPGIVFCASSSSVHFNYEVTNKSHHTKTGLKIFVGQLALPNEEGHWYVVRRGSRKGASWPTTLQLILFMATLPERHGRSVGRLLIEMQVKCPPSIVQVKGRLSRNYGNSKLQSMETQYNTSLSRGTTFFMRHQLLCHNSKETKWRCQDSQVAHLTYLTVFALCHPFSRFFNLFKFCNIGPPLHACLCQLHLYDCSFQSLPQ